MLKITQRKSVWGSWCISMKRYSRGRASPYDTNISFCTIYDEVTSKTKDYACFASPRENQSYTEIIIVCLQTYHMQHSRRSRPFRTKDNMTIWYRFHNVYTRAKILWITHDSITILYNNTLMLISKQKCLKQNYWGALCVANLMGCIWSIHSRGLRIELFYVVPNKNHTVIYERLM